MYRLVLGPKDPNLIGLPETGSKLLIIRILDPNSTGGTGLKTQQVCEDKLGRYPKIN